MGVRYRWPYVALTVLYCAGIFHLSSQPLIEAPPLFEFPGDDKVIHAVIFGGLAALICIGLWRSNDRVDRRFLFWGPAAFAIVYGITDEVHQLYVPDRTFDWLDLAADGAGALAVQAVLAGWAYPRFSKGKHPA